MKNYKKFLIFPLVLLLFICTACEMPEIYWGNDPSRLEYGFAREISQEEQALRLNVIQTAEKWLGTVQGTDEHRKILSIYNEHTPLAQGYIVQESDKWCATFGSTVAIECDLTHIIPTECGCQRQIGLFEEISCWQEDDSYIPLPGDIIYYSSKDENPKEDCTGWSDHVGIVAGTCDDYIKVIEGNFVGTVSYHYIKINSKGIRGYALPHYAGQLSTEGETS
jgi:hypothetical protein